MPVLRSLNLGGVLHVEDLIVGKYPVQISTLDVNLIQLQVVLIGHSNEEARRCQLHHRSVSIIIVYSSDLTEALCDQACLLLYDVPRGVLFGLEDPFGAYNIGSWWCMLVSPGPCSLEGG